jgi:hypothetical protein
MQFDYFNLMLLFQLAILDYDILLILIFVDISNLAEHFKYWN